jgi:excisionase family DNA binding protein
VKRSQSHSRRTLTVPEAATVLGVAVGTVYRAVRAGTIPALRVGRLVLIPREGLDHLLGDRGGRHEQEIEAPLRDGRR